MSRVSIKKTLFIVFILLVSTALGIFFYRYGVKKKPFLPILLKESTFTELPHWDNGDRVHSLLALRRSCHTFLKQDAEKQVGSAFIPIKVRDWQPLCKAAFTIDDHSDNAIKMFFETWFKPMYFYQHQAIEGLFTGYYMPTLKGSLGKTNRYSVPVYGIPKEMITVPLTLFDKALKDHRPLVGRVDKNKLVPYYTREEINKGAIDSLAPILVWLESRLDRHFLEIEGSGIIQLPNGKRFTLGYAAENGAPYTSLAQLLIDEGLMTRHNASKRRIREFFKTHSKKASKLLDKNQSFVFFNKRQQEEAIGAQGVALTPGYSLAIDRKWVPMGTPVWLDTQHPTIDDSPTKPLQRLMIAQDTGGAIRGPVRGDVYWGCGQKATKIANHMKYKGYYWLLLPKTVVETINNK